eukprot:GHVU01173508.1.p4 GENE.GHVU01173508.1~~GHVU01173508.1.p4  ORF type:complete len:104 (+),score=18.54 GHVU01173508.1:926-1237(+)
MGGSITIPTTTTTTATATTTTTTTTKNQQTQKDNKKRERPLILLISYCCYRTLLNRQRQFTTRPTTYMTEGDRVYAYTHAAHTNAHDTRNTIWRQWKQVHACQ